MAGIRIVPHQAKGGYPRRCAALALAVFLASGSYAFALDPTLDVRQYAHTAWRVSEGFAKGIIFAIAQTSDGYLWLGTEFGLLRFDGVRAVPWQPPAGDHLPSSDIRSLRGARDGRLWIGTFSGLASWKDGQLTHYPELDGQVIEALLEDREGTIWVGGWTPSVGRLCAIQGGNVHCYGEDGQFGAGVNALYEDRAGNLWVGAMTGVWRWKPGPPKLYPMPDPAHRIYSLAESDDDGILVAKRSGITKLRNGKAVPYPLPAGARFQVHRLLRDRDGALWIGDIVDRGLLHVHEGRPDEFNTADGLSGEAVSSLFEDREGNIWVTTLGGLDRFRDFAVPTISVQQGLSSRGVTSVLAATDGSLWLGTSDGLNRSDKDQITIYRRRRPPGRGSSSASGFTAGTTVVREVTDAGLPDAIVDSVFQDNLQQIWVGTQSGVAVFKSGRFVPVPFVPHGIVYAIAGDSAGNVWMSHQAGLFHVLQERLVERIPWAQLGRREPATALRHDAVQGGSWLGFRDGGVAYFKDGQLRASYGGHEGLAEGTVHGFHGDGNGTLWAATEGGLSRIKDGRLLTLTSRNGLPCDTVHWLMGDDADSVWLYMACGLVRIARSELDAWVSHPEQTIQPTVFGTSDGVSNHRISPGYGSVVAKSRDGRLWFVGSGGVSIVDPHHLPFNTLAPPVHIEQIIADGKTHQAAQGLRLPPLVRDLQIDFTALSFVAPEKVRFRLRLEGFDLEWRDADTRRQAFYTNLAPGTYRFRVIASNNNGVWNEAGATLDFSIAPAYYQTQWFAAFVVLAAASLLWAIYQLRVAQLARQFHRTLDARVSERTRIARDLHDTLLQSLQGLLLRFHSALSLLPARPEEARDRLELALDQAEAAITEGRDAVQGLRASGTTVNDLANGIAAIGAELTDTPSVLDPAAIAVDVDGASRALNPVVRDEAYRIAGEALRNAFIHAQARTISVTIHYEPRQFRLVVRDDGKGINADTIQRQQVAGHFGLAGMRERAAIVKGRLDVRSAPGAGSEIELRVPAAIAYGASTRTSWWPARFSRQSFNKRE